MISHEPSHVYQQHNNLNKSERCRPIKKKYIGPAFQVHYTPQMQHSMFEAFTEFNSTSLFFCNSVVLDKFY